MTGPIAPPSRVKATLTPDGSQRRRRTRRYVETREFAAMVARMLRAYGRRVARADMDDLTDMVALRATLDEIITATVRHLRQHQDFSWSAIGAAVGTTRQAAQQRYGHPGDVPPGDGRSEDRT